MKWLSYHVLRLIGWRFEGKIPDVPKMVVIGAPHTSNWDFFLLLAALHHFGISVRFLGKKTLFRWPLGFMFRRVGGIPVDRSGPGGVVEQVTTTFESIQRMILVIAPEGTRRAAPYWRSGFLKIARGAGVPIVMAGVDGEHKVLSLSDAYEVMGDETTFMGQVRAFYADKNGMNPRGKGPVRIAEETTRS